MECLYKMLGMFFLGVAFSFMFGLAVGMLHAYRSMVKYLMGDPDGEGGWHSRLEQLGQRHFTKPVKKEEEKK